MYIGYICQRDILHSITKLFPAQPHCFNEGCTQAIQTGPRWGTCTWENWFPQALRQGEMRQESKPCFNCPPPPPCFPKLHFHRRLHPHCLHSLPALVWLSLHHLSGGSLPLVSSKDIIMKSSQKYLMFLKGQLQKHLTTPLPHGAKILNRIHSSKGLSLATEEANLYSAE